MSQEPVRIVIIMDGGLIEQIITAGVPVEVLIMDYDIEGADEDRIVDLGIDKDGPAYVSLHQAEQQGAYADQAFAAFKELHS